MNGDGWMTAFAVAVTVAVLAFWGTVAYVALHFIGKFW